MRASPDRLKKDLASVIDPPLATAVVDRYLEMQQRYYAGDWHPSELNGGQFCEAAARAICQIDTSVDSTASVGEICSQLRKVNSPPAHALGSKDRYHFCRVLQAAYALRNDRGVAHISLDHTANQMDAALIVSITKWLFCELLRLSQKLDRKEVAATIEEIVQLEHPLIHELGGQPMVMSTTLSVSEEALLLLNHAPGKQLSKHQISTYIPASANAIHMAILRLRERRYVRVSGDGDIVITPLGQRLVFEQIVPKARTEVAAGTRGAAKRRSTRQTGAALSGSKPRATARSQPK